MLLRVYFIKAVCECPAGSMLLRVCFIKAVCETHVCVIIDQSLFYIDLTVHYIQSFVNLT
jgi:hypothetical protein